MSMKNVFVIDANAIIVASKHYYHNEVAMPFWDLLKRKF